MILLNNMLCALYDTVITALATVIASVLNHPKANDAITNVIVNGITKFLTQPNLHEHILVANQSLGKTRDTMANKAGQDFPKVVGAFVKGMFLPAAANNENNQNNNKDENDATEKDSLLNKARDNKIMDSKTNDTNKRNDEPVVSSSSSSSTSSSSSGRAGEHSEQHQSTSAPIPVLAK
jgi:hypothetical protein